MEIFLIAISVIAICIALLEKKKAVHHTTQPTQLIQPNDTESEAPTLDFKNAYQKKWLFSYNEKDAYHALKPVADKYGYTIFAKVRLLDLLEPQKGNPKYKTFFYKIQAKHVDFVLCDQKLVARFIIELDDSSHNQQSRKERDEFVDDILTNVGYKILHIKAVKAEEIEALIKPPA